MMKDWIEKLPSGALKNKIISKFIELCFDTNEDQINALIEKQLVFESDVVIHTHVTDTDIYIFITSNNLFLDLKKEISINLSPNYPIAYTLRKYEKFSFNDNVYSVRICAFGIYCYELSRAIINRSKSRK